MKFELTATVGRPVEEVWAFHLDFARWPEWDPAVTEARQTSDGPMDVGGTVAFAGKAMGRRWESVTECTACEPNRRYATRTTSGPIYMEVDNIFEAVDGGTRITTRVRAESRGFLKLMGPFPVRMVRKQFEAGTENAKALLEGAADTA